MNIKVKYITNTGLKRPTNEDSILIDKMLISKVSMGYSEEREFLIEQQFLCAVADGMGGHGKGEVASDFLLNSLNKHMQELKELDNLQEILFKVKNELDAFAKYNIEYKNIGTTLSGILFAESEFVVFSIGDSRVYENNRGYAKQLSKDHSFVFSLYESGEIAYEDIKKHSQRHIVTSAFIANENEKLSKLFIKKFTFETFPKAFLICSDGVWEVVELNDLDQCFKESNPIEFLKEKILNNGANDNFSAIYIKGLK